MRNISCSAQFRLHTVAGKRALEISMLFFLVLFSDIGLLTSLRLKAELEECLHKIDQIVSQTGVGPISALSEAKGVPTSKPKRREKKIARPVNPFSVSAIFAFSTQVGDGSRGAATQV